MDSREKFLDVFWLESPETLFLDLEFVPSNDISIERRLNAITRVILIVFIVLLVMKYKHALTFLLIALIIVIWMYYSRRGRRDSRSQGRDFEWTRFETRNGNQGSSGIEVEKTPKHRTANIDNKPKQNPRVPYPPVVGEDLEVKASNKFGTVFVQESDNPTMKQFQNWIQDEEPVPTKPEPAKQFAPKDSDDIEANRQKNMMRSFQGGPRKHYGYLAEAENDLDAEDSDDEQEPVMAKTEAPVSSRRFRPANYDPVYDDPDKIITPNPNRLRPGRFSSGKNARRVPRYSDDKQETRISGTDIMFNRAAKLEKVVNSRLRIDRQSQINSIF